MTIDYTYDAAGNVLELQQNLGPGTVVTTYTYDAANRLITVNGPSSAGFGASGPGILWQTCPTGFTNVQPPELAKLQ